MAHQNWACLPPDNPDRCNGIARRSYGKCQFLPWRQPISRFKKKGGWGWGLEGEEPSCIGATRTSWSANIFFCIQQTSFGAVLSTSIFSTTCSLEVKESYNTLITFQDYTKHINIRCTQLCKLKAQPSHKPKAFCNQSPGVQ